MDISPALAIMLMTIPALVVVLVTAVRAKTLNAQWRARREERANAKASSAH